jgi:hypothetical protein
MTMPSAWAVCQSIGERYAGVAAACMNTIGTLGAAASIWMTGMLVEHSLASKAMTIGVAADNFPTSEKHVASLVGYDQAFVTYAAAYLLAAAGWHWIDPTRSIMAQTAPVDSA